MSKRNPGSSDEPAVSAVSKRVNLRHRNAADPRQADDVVLKRVPRTVAGGLLEIQPAAFVPGTEPVRARLTPAMDVTPPLRIGDAESVKRVG